MKNQKNRFVSEVQFGILAIIFILLLISFSTNYKNFKVRGIMREEIHARLSKASMIITRELSNFTSDFSKAGLRHDLALRYHLSSVIVIPSQPSRNDAEARRQWFSSIVALLPPGQVPEVASKVLSGGYDKITRGNENEYFMISSVNSSFRHKILVVSINEPLLAYIEDASMNTMYVTIACLSLVIMIYIWLLRFIMSPFHRMKKQAVEAGRSTLYDGSADVDEVIEDHRNMIEELKEKELELLRLNREIQRRADTLEEFNEHLLESTEAGVITVDTKGKILSANRSAVDMLNLPKQNLQGTTLDNLGWRENRLMQLILETVETGARRPYREISIDTSQGQRLNLGLTISPIEDDNHTLIGHSIFLTDLTEIQNLRMALETKTRLSALGEMAGGLAHQLRNSMGAIAGYSRLAEKRMNQAGVDSSSLAAAQQEVQDAESLIERFLSFARPLTIQPEPIQLTVLLKEIIQNIKAGDINCEIELNSEENLPELSADPLMIKQALGNLLHNAAQASDNNARIDITLKAQGESCVIIIQDHGRGIAPENLSMIFTPFFSTRPSGNGLGLPLAAKIIDLHGGEISVESILDRGTEFTVILPIRVTIESSSQITA